MCICKYIFIYMYIDTIHILYEGPSHLLEPHTMGWDVNVHVTLQMQLMQRPHGLGRDVNVHVTLQTQLMMMMMMMIMMKLVNSATQFRHGIDKLYQPNSGLRGSRRWDGAIYTHIEIQCCILMYIP